MNRLKLTVTVSTLALGVGIVFKFGIGEQKVRANPNPQNAACVQDCKTKRDSCLSEISPNTTNRDGLRQGCQESYNSCVNRCPPQKNQAQ